MGDKDHVSLSPSLHVSLRFYRRLICIEWKKVWEMENSSELFSKFANKIRNLGWSLTVATVVLIYNPFFVLHLSFFPRCLSNWHEFCNF